MKTCRPTRYDRRHSIVGSAGRLFGRFGLFVALTLAWISVAASYDLQTKAEPVFVVETVDSPSARIAHVQIHVVDREIAVTGYLRKRHREQGLIPGRLVIEILADDGSILAKTDGPYHRSSAKATRSYFSETLPVGPDEIGSVRLTHYGLDQ